MLCLHNKELWALYIAYNRTNNTQMDDFKKCLTQALLTLQKRKKFNKNVTMHL